MADEIPVSDRESALLARIAALEAEAKFSERIPPSGNMVEEVWRYLRAFIPLPILLGGIGIFLAFHGWEWYFSSQLSTVETRLKDAKAALEEAKSAAAASRGDDGDPLQVEAFLAQLKKKQADASRAQADAAAQNTIVNNESLRLQTLRAEVASKQAQAAKARAAADAARKREGLLTLEEKAARVKLLQTEIQAIGNTVQANGGLVTAAEGRARIREIICANKYAELFGCPASYVRRYKVSLPPINPDTSGRAEDSRASFNCDSATRIDEQTVCASTELRRLDRQMATAYQHAGGRSNSQALSIQRRFMSSRRACGSDASCIRDATLQAINAYRQ